MKVLKMLLRVYTNDFDMTLAAYGSLAGSWIGERFSLPDLGFECARVGSLLIIGGTEEALSPYLDTTATMIVDSVEEFLEYSLLKGAMIVRPLLDTPIGRSMILRHREGTSIEYIERKKKARRILKRVA
jgi:hypothetical protein